MPPGKEGIRLCGPSPALTPGPPPLPLPPTTHNGCKLGKVVCVRLSRHDNVQGSVQLILLHHRVWMALLAFGLCQLGVGHGAPRSLAPEPTVRKSDQATNASVLSSACTHKVQHTQFPQSTMHAAGWHEGPCAWAGGPVPKPKSVERSASTRPPPTLHRTKNGHQARHPATETVTSRRMRASAVAASLAIAIRFRPWVGDCRF